MVARMAGSSMWAKDHVVADILNNHAQEIEAIQDQHNKTVRTLNKNQDIVTARNDRLELRVRALEKLVGDLHVSGA